MSIQVSGESTITEDVSRVLSAFTGEVMRHGTADLLRLMRREDLSMPRLVALMYLHKRRGATSISDISDYLNLTLGTTSHLVDQLVSSEFVRREEDPCDRRQKLVSLTTRGERVVEEAKRARVKELARRLECLPRPLLKQTLQVMGEVLEHLRAAEEQ